MSKIIVPFSDDIGSDRVPHSDEDIADTGKFISMLDFVLSKSVRTRLKMLMSY
jgi:hypothetical protein